MVSQIARGLQGQATLTVDVNQAWDGNTARRYLPRLIDAGVTLIEQPVAKWNVEALKTLTTTLGDRAAIMADETVCSPQDALMIARAQASHVFSLKVAKHGGLLRTRQVAGIAERPTSAGTAAPCWRPPSARPPRPMCSPPWARNTTAANCSARNCWWTTSSPSACPSSISSCKLPDGPGFGIEVDLAQLERFDRARAGLAATHIDLGRNATH